jgi:coenzyme F420-reducing hydrogenase alpha subunit
MAAAVANKDAQIDDTLSKEQALKAALMQQRNATKTTMGRGGYLPSEAEGYNKEITRFQEKIDDISTKIKGDLFNSYQQNASIADLTTDIQSSMTSGNLSKYQMNMQSMQGFMKENKDVSPDLLKAAVEDINNKWGGNTIKEDGTYSMISDHLPSKLYDDNTQLKADKYGTKVDKSFDINTRTGLIAARMNIDQEVVNTIAQRLKYKLLTDNNGNIINPDELSPEGQKEAITNEIKRQANITAVISQKPIKPTSTTIAKDKNTYDWHVGKSSSRADQGVIVNSLITNARESFPNASTTFEAINLQLEKNNVLIKANADEFGNELTTYDKTNLKIETAILEQQYTNIINQTAKDINEKNTSSWKAIGTTRGEKLGNLTEQRLNEQYGTPKKQRVTAGWSISMPDKERKIIAQQVKDYMGTDAFKDINLKSENTAETTTLRQLEKQSIVSKKEHDVAVALIEQNPIKGRIMKNAVIEGDYHVTRYTEPGTDGDITKEVRTLVEYGEVKINSTYNILPTDALDTKGTNAGFKIGITVNGKDQEYYVSSNAFEGGKIATTINNPHTDYNVDNNSAYLYNMMSSEIQNGEKITIYNTVIENNNGTLKLYDSKFTDGFTTNKEEIKSYLMGWID